MRIFRNQEQWKVIIEKQQASGLTIINYCREHQL
ncbi:MAG: IS66 family insertion sequence element accessory protein TnpB, partial [Colwellia sp.]|nr:IS66 family insertion sequence element accessory protein TnpB [Colwellia sp.]